MSSIGSSRGPGSRGSSVAVGGPGGMRASSPRPSAFRCTFEYLPRQLPIAVGASAMRVIENDGFAEGGRLAELYVARHQRPVNPVRKELASFLRDLLGEVQAGVVHGEQHALDS